MMIPLRELVSVQARYSRSVNLERDLDLPQATDGYLPTPRALNVLTRIARATLEEHAVRAWSVTSVYGTGKSAFAQFLAALFAPKTTHCRRLASKILRETIKAAEAVEVEQPSVLDRFLRAVPPEGYVRAVATCRREPIGTTIMRALARGTDQFWANRAGRRPLVVRELARWRGLGSDAPPPSDEIVLQLLRETAEASGTGVLLALDELGKALEAAALRSNGSDLYLLQQVAEASTGATRTPIVFLTLQHQEFSAYANQLSQAQQQEWEKVSGRFEQIPFQEASEEMLRLIGRVLVTTPHREFQRKLKRFAEEWHAYFKDDMADRYLGDVLTRDRIRSLYPLHPLSAIVLPMLCARFAQNDRSLFSFLASNETHSLARFIAENGSSDEELPTLKLPDVYDYFVAAAGGSGGMHMQRWLEVHGAITETAGINGEELRALKTIGTLNLVASGGPLRASQDMVMSALSSSARKKSERRRWSELLDGLVSRGVITYRDRIDEYRLWAGTDFDVRGAIADRTARESRPLALLLEGLAPQPPIVAERHSYRTGTLRLFETRFLDNHEQLAEIALRQQHADGVIIYWTSNAKLKEPPHSTKDGRPLVVVPIGAPDALLFAAKEVAAIRTVIRDESALRTDGVARKEVTGRLRHAENAVQVALRDAISSTISPVGEVWLAGRAEKVSGRRAFNAALSRICDLRYDHSPILWNELLNRRELTSQGARARRELLEAMLVRGSEPRLGLSGEGPEVSMYRSTLELPLIHAKRSEAEWSFGAPPPGSGLYSVWDVVERFCVDARGSARRLAELYELLARPPYGLKPGAVPILLAAVLIAHSEDVSVYRDGTFLPVLAAEHFELLVKQPDRFAIRSFALEGVHADVLRVLCEIVATSRPSSKVGQRNASLLGVVRPLVRFAVGLPPLTRRTERVSSDANAVRTALLSAREPDELVFSTLPAAVGLRPIGDTGPTWEADLFRQRLRAALRELANHVDRTLDTCQLQLLEAFGIQTSPGRLREDLRVRAQYLVGRVVEPHLRRFVLAATDVSSSDEAWLKALVMVISDRPVDAWSDLEVDTFELQVGDLARRFQTLEALQRDGAVRRDSADVRRVSLTDAGGYEILGLVWMDDHEREKMDRLAGRVQALLADLPTSEMREALTVRVLESLMKGRLGGRDIDDARNDRDVISGQQERMDG